MTQKSTTTGELNSIDPISHLNILHNNPFIFSSAMVAFYEELREKEHSLLLSYLVLPLVLHRRSRAILCNAKDSSSLVTMIASKKFVHGLAERVEDYKDLTNLTIQYLIGAQAIKIHGSKISILNQSEKLDKTSPDGLIKAARRLAIFFNAYEIPMIYRMLGVLAL
ncbi:three component ABC system middle component [Undibacterium sp. Di26W]|uniref:three component ABC system middle component n=1 Tax=Undibacterium sp. Di26W TaxID=3413035 RepID=UPI003BF1C13D